MRRWIGMLSLGLGVYLIALVISLPAERAAEWGSELVSASGVRFSAAGVSGTAWSGSAASATVNGMTLGRTEWSLSPWWLPFGRAQLHWRVEPEGGYLEGDSRMGMGGMQLRDIQGSVPAPLLVSLLAKGPLFVTVDGKVNVRVEELVHRDGKIESAKGTVAWSQAALLQPAAVRLGDLKVEFSTDASGALSGKLSDGGGPLALSGTVVLNPNMTYRLNATLAAREGADAALASSLPLIGRADGKGGYQVTWSGRM